MKTSLGGLVMFLVQMLMSILSTECLTLKHNSHESVTDREVKAKLVLN